MNLGQFPAEGQPPVPQNVPDVVKGGHQLVGRFVENQGVGVLFKALKVLHPVVAGGGEKTLKGEPGGGEPA